MATRKPNYQVKTETSKTTNRYQDGELPAKPSGARFKGRGNYDRPTQEMCYLRSPSYQQLGFTFGVDRL